jgi:hypothetical protein
MLVTLIRRAYMPKMGVFGELTVKGERFFTVEKPWSGNEPFHSCIPEGKYKANTLPTTTPVPEGFQGKTWYLHGGSVGIDVGLRTRIAIHIANTAQDVAGCIGVGKRLSCLRGQWSVAHSMDALTRLRTLLPDEFELKIVNGASTVDADIRD